MDNYYSSDLFEKVYTYSGTDLGAVWTPEYTAFRLWAPTAKKVILRLYQSGNPEAQDALEDVAMIPDCNGTWLCKLSKNCNGLYYTYQVTVGGKTIEACDPYARATGVNGKRAMVLDLASTNPAGWSKDKDPNASLRFTDCVIYELHVRDLSIHSSSGITCKGKFLGVGQSGTTTKDGIPTGLDHIKSLGITHLHLLPVYDYGSVDESHLEKPQYNWGYDPENYNVPEGSYATDPFHGEVRVREMKQMIKNLHDNGISVIMDVVYNHVYHRDTFCFNQIVPGYFSRIDENGDYSNGSFCGNDTASERSMVRKYIVDSVNHWADEYHIDGFRFDIVGLLDTDTINEVMHTVLEKHPNAKFYGEGWHMPTTLTKPNIYLANQSNAAKMPGFAHFNDTIRDLVRGSYADRKAPGLAAGGKVAQKDIANAFEGKTGWTEDPGQIINYISCHDDNTLFDRLAITLPDAPRSELVRRNNLGAAFNILAQGIPFIQAGEEMLRSKKKRGGSFEHNSYRSPDSVNAIRWSELKNEDTLLTFRYYQGLIAIRKAFPVFRMRERKRINSSIEVVPCKDNQSIGFLLYDKDYRMFVCFNNSAEEIRYTLPDGKWYVLVFADQAGTTALECVQTQTVVPPISTFVAVQYREMLHE